MNDITLKKLRFFSVVVAMLVFVIALWWSLFASHKTVLVFTTGSGKGLYYRLATELKSVIEDNHPDIIIKLQTSAGSNENIKRLDAGEAQLGLAQNDVSGGKSVRSIAGIYPEVLHLLCRTDANIHSLPDLSGHHIGIGAPGSGTEQFTQNLLFFANVKTDATEITRAPFGVTLQKLRAGELDAAFVLTGLGADIIADALADDDLTLAAIQMQDNGNADADLIARTFTDGFRVQFPNVSPQTIPLMAYDGRPTTPVPSMGVHAVLVCQTGIEPGIVERITRTLFEQRAVLSQKEPIFNYLAEQTAQAQLQFPLHQGAENYYRRREPGFLAQNAELMGFLVTIVLLCWSVLVWVRRWYVQSRKNRIDIFYQAIDDVVGRLHIGINLEELDELESELMNIQQRASDGLVQERLSANESFVIYQNMLDGCQTMLTRMRERIRESSGKEV